MRPVLRYMIVLSAGTVLALGLLSGCSAQMTDKVDNDSIGNPDYETTYYSSAVIKIPVDPDDYIEYAAFDKLDGNVCVVPTSHIIRDDDDGPAVCYVVNKAGIESSFTLDLEYAEASFAGIDEDRFIISDYYSGAYNVFDYNGNLLASCGDGSEVSMYGGHVAVSGDRIAIGNASGVAILDTDLNLLGTIAANAGYTLFAQDGKFYAVDGYSINYLDIDNYIAVFKAFADDFELPDYGNGVRDFKYYQSRSDGKIYEADIENKNLVPVAMYDNILEYQGTITLWNSATTNLSIINNSCFYRTFNYSGCDYCEMALYYADPDLDLSEREVITVGGVNIAYDSYLHQAVYQYNVSQDLYLVKVVPLAVGYDYSIPEEAQQANLELINSFQRGESPDIFYGNTFDYQYWGKSGMVLDIKPYLENAVSFDEASMIENIYDLMCYDGKIYQVFAGFGLQGYYGDASQYSDSNVSIFNMPQLVAGQDRFSTSLSSGIAFNIFSLDLKRIYDHGELTEDAVRDLVSLAVNEGINESEYLSLLQMNGYQEIDDSNASLIDTTVFRLGDYYDMYVDRGELPVWIGYPSLSGSIHPIYPACQMAVSAGTTNLEACCDFISFLFDEDYQRNIASGGFIPVNETILSEILDVMTDPSSLTEEMRIYYWPHIIREYPDYDSDEYVEIPLDDSITEAFLDTVQEADSITVYDWGVQAIIQEELDVYYNSGRSLEDTASALYSRLLIYAQENY